MPQFFIKSQNINDDSIKLNNKQDIKHITEVLRLKSGSEIIFIDENEMLYKCVVKHSDKDCLTASILDRSKSTRRLNTDITLIQSILKSSAQDITIQKATELGVQNILPITTEHTVVKFKNDKEKTKKVERWQKISDESCKQCERSKPAKIQNITTLSEALKQNFDIKIACVERSATKSLKKALQSHNYKNQKVAIFVGPEGGWSDNELKLFKENDLEQASLGNLILRAETAVINAISSVIYEYEN